MAEEQKYLGCILAKAAISTGTVRKSAIFPHQAMKNGLNEALLMSINEALLSRQNFVPFE